MDTREILENGSLVAPEVAPPAPATEKPAISHDDYLELATLRSKQNDLKMLGWDVQEFITKGEEQLRAERERLEQIRTDLSEVTDELQQRFNDVVAPFGFQGMVTISDTEPHYITPQN